MKVTSQFLFGHTTEFLAEVEMVMTLYWLRSYDRSTPWPFSIGNYVCSYRSWSNVGRLRRTYVRSRCTDTMYAVELSK